jgi:Fe2+ or Zn2+ uptake regulation protein
MTRRDAATPTAALQTTAEQLLRRLNQRLTSGRAEILEVLARAAGPLTIPEILDASPRLAQSSAYRNLVVLEAAGIVQRVVTRDEFARYELNEELTSHHHHLVCDGCGRVEDLPAGAGLERALAAAIVDAQRRRGFRVDEHRLDLIGRCVDCA